MATKNQEASGLTLKQLLIAVIVIGILTIVGSVALLIQRNVSNSPSIEQTLQAAREVLLETKNKAANEGKKYTIEFRNSHEGIEYLISQSSSASEWKKLSRDTSITVKNSKIVFDYESNKVSTSSTQKLSFEYKQHKCLVIDPDLKNIREEEGVKCK